MPSKLENDLSLFISVRKWVSSVLTSGLTFNFTQVKVKGRHASLQGVNFTSEKNSPNSKTPL